MLIGIFFFFNDTATTEIYTLSLHDALPISRRGADTVEQRDLEEAIDRVMLGLEKNSRRMSPRSEEHTSELQSRLHLVCRLLLEKKNIASLFHENPQHLTSTHRHSLTRAEHD